MAKRILIVEDDEFIIDLYKHQFEKNDFTVEVAGNGHEGLAKAEQGSFDVILLDIMMPELNGIEFLEKLGHEKLKKQKVVVLSNFSQDEIVQHALQLGARSFIIKSLYTPEQVVSEIQSITRS